MDFLGLFDVDATLYAAVPITDGNSAPVDPSSAPVYRIYDGITLLASGVLSKLDSGTITGATNASPIVLISAAHGLQDNNIVKVASVGGNTAANGTFAVTRVSADTFSLNSSTGNASYTSGGTWHVAGLYQLSQSLLASLGFAAGKSYQALITWNDGSANRTKLLTFGVL